MNVEDLSLEWNFNKMCVLQLAADEGDLCAGDGETLVPIFCVSLMDLLSKALPHPLFFLFSSNRVTKEVDSNSKEAKSFLKQQEKLQSAAPGSLPTVSGWVWDFPAQVWALSEKDGTGANCAGSAIFNGCFLQDFSESKTRPGRCDDSGWREGREATRELQWLTSYVQAQIF